MWELLQSSIIPVIIVVVLLRLFGGRATGSPNTGANHLDMDMVKEATVVKVDKSSKKITELLAENDIILFYFSAHWCPPCRAFTPVLAVLYKELKKAGKKIEIIFMSSDRSEEQMTAYMKESHGDWYSFEFNSPLRRAFGEHFGVSGIPTLIVFSGKGILITKNAVSDVAKHGASIWEKWTAPDAKA